MIPQQRNRRRGVILTPGGLEKLQQAKTDSEINEKREKRHTLETLGDRARLDPDTVAKVFACEIGVDKKTLKLCFAIFGLQLEPEDYQWAHPDHRVQKNNNGSHNCDTWSTTDLVPNVIPIQYSKSTTQNHIDWGEVPDASLFLGRTAELATLKQWILGETSGSAVPCRLLTLWGLAGMGKTWLSVKLAQELQEQFEFVIWRSLHPPLPLSDLLADLLTNLSNGQDIPLPDTLHGRISCLIRQLKQHRCLLILDQADFALQHCILDQPDCQSCAWLPYKEEAQAYCDLFRRIGETAHQSCVILTSREAPQELRPLEGKIRPVRTFQVNGLPVSVVQTLFNINSPLEGTTEEWNTLVQAYAGNPRALTLVATTIQILFSGKIADFLQQATPLFGQVSSLIEQQLRCLTEPAHAVLYTLAAYAQPVSFTELRSHLAEAFPPHILIEALELLQGRSLITSNSGKFSLHPLVLEYIHLQPKQQKPRVIQQLSNNQTSFYVGKPTTTGEYLATRNGNGWQSG